MKFTSEFTPLVSIVIPVKDGAATLRNCLLAIRRSYYRKFEVIVVNDHSTEQTPQIAAEFDAKILEAGEGRGANSARNLGASKATGDILIFIDADIIVNRETILGIVESLEE